MADILVLKSLAVLSWIVTQVNKLNPAHGQAHLFDDEEKCSEKKGIFHLGNNEPGNN